MGTQSALLEVIDFPKPAYEVMLRTALDRYSMAQFAEAETLLAGLIALAPDDARPYKLLGSIRLLSERRNEAAQAYQEAIRLDPADPYSLVALAEIRLHELRIEDAVALFEKLFALDPKREHPATLRGKYLVAEAYQRLSTAR